MADVIWEGNSKAMFEKCIEASPKPFRAKTEKNLMDTMLAKAAGGAITENIIIEAVKAVTPKPFVGMALKNLEPLKTA